MAFQALSSAWTTATPVFRMQLPSALHSSHCFSSRFPNASAPGPLHILFLLPKHSLLLLVSSYLSFILQLRHDFLMEHCLDLTWGPSIKVTMWDNVSCSVVHLSVGLETCEQRVASSEGRLFPQFPLPSIISIFPCSRISGSGESKTLTKGNEGS